MLIFVEHKHKSLWRRSPAGSFVFKKNTSLLFTKNPVFMNCFFHIFHPKTQYTCFFEKGHVKNSKKRPLPGRPQVSSRSWFLQKIDKSVGIIDESDILPHPHGCHRHVLPNGTPKTYFLIEKYLFLLEMGPKPYKNQEFPYNSPIFAFWQRRASTSTDLGKLIFALWQMLDSRPCRDADEVIPASRY